MPLFKEHVRRPHEDFRGRHIYFVTVGTAGRAPYLADQSTGEWLLRLLLQTAAQWNFSLHAYCIMPDHVHLLCEGLSDTSDLLQFVGAFKQRTAYEFEKTHEGRLWPMPHNRLWRMPYNAHILRPEEVIEDVACYIWWNPVRKGLCDDPHAYPLSGSQTIDWIRRSTSRTNWTPPWKPNTGL